MTTKITTRFNKGGAPYPSTCKICGAYDRELLGLTIIQPREGMLLFCQQCFTAMVHDDLDFATVEKKESLDELVEMLFKAQKINTIQGEAITKMKELSSDLKDKIDAAVSGFHSSLGDSSPGSDGASNGVDSSENLLPTFKDV